MTSATRQATGPAEVQLTLPLTLASASPRRAEILRSAGFQFEVRPAGIDESAVPWAGGFEDLATSLAEAKAEAALTERPSSIALGADTIVVLDDEALGKPQDEQQAVEMLRRLRGRSHDVITGVAVAGPQGVLSKAAVTRVGFREYSDAEIRDYVASGSPLDKAGAYGIQDEAFSPAESVEGCYLNVVGLPLCAVTSLLRAGGYLETGARVPSCDHKWPASRMEMAV